MCVIKFKLMQKLSQFSTFLIFFPLLPRCASKTIKKETK